MILSRTHEQRVRRLSHPKSVTGKRSLQSGLTSQLTSASHIVATHHKKESENYKRNYSFKQG